MVPAVVAAVPVGGGGDPVDVVVKVPSYPLMPPIDPLAAGAPVDLTAPAGLPIDAGQLGGGGNGTGGGAAPVTVPLAQFASASDAIAALIMPAPVDVPLPATVPPPLMLPVPANPLPETTSTAREIVPASMPGAGAIVPEGFRVGYATYLRSAQMKEIAGVALAGLAGLFAFTAVGGLIGYRQAKAGLAVRAAGTSRFLQ